jgi:hypothetical protein
MKKITLLLLFLLITGCGFKEEEIVNPVINNNEGVTLSQTVNDFLIDDVVLYYESGLSNYRFTINNQSENAKTIESISVIFKNQSGSIITTLTQNVNQTIDQNIVVKMISDIDLSQAYSVEYQINES